MCGQNHEAFLTSGTDRRAVVFDRHGRADRLTGKNILLNWRVIQWGHGASSLRFVTDPYLDLGRVLRTIIAHRRTATAFR